MRDKFLFVRIQLDSEKGLFNFFTVPLVDFARCYDSMSGENKGSVYNFEDNRDVAIITRGIVREFLIFGFSKTEMVKHLLETKTINLIGQNLNEYLGSGNNMFI